VELKTYEVKVWVSDIVIQEIFQEGRNKLPNETGGVLVGYKTSDTEFVVTKIIGPGPKAIHRRSSFLPDQEFHEAEIAKVYLDSGCCETYIGDWHTHPYSTAYLSGQDRSTLRKIAKYKRARISTPIMLVAAPPQLVFKIWTYRNKRKCASLFDEIFETHINVYR